MHITSWKECTWRKERGECKTTGLISRICLKFAPFPPKTAKMIELESMARYVSPVNPAVFPHLTVVLLGIGIFFTAWFFVYEVTSTKFTRDIFKELLVALVAAIFTGLGILFLLLWVGIYV